MQIPPKNINMQKLPNKITHYLRDTFEDGYTVKVIVPKEKANDHYLVDYVRNETLYHLEFDKEGNLLKSEKEAFFSDDYSYSDFFTDD